MLTVIYQKTGQTISHVPPGRVSSPTYLIENTSLAADHADRVIGSGNAENPSWSITSTAAAGADQRNAARVSATTTTGAVVGAACSIVAPDGAREVFRIAKISANSYIEAETDLAGMYPIGSVVQGIEFTASVPDVVASNASIFAASIEDDGNDIPRQRDRPIIRVVWTYTLDGVVYRIPEPVQFVRHTSSMNGAVGQALLEIRELYPDMPGRLAEGGDLDRIVGRMADRVSNDLRRHHLKPELYMMGPRGCELIVARMLMLASQHGYAPGATVPDRKWREEVAAAYTTLLAAVVSEDPGVGVALTEHASDTLTTLPVNVSRGELVDTVQERGLSRLRSW